MRSYKRYKPRAIKKLLSTNFLNLNKAPPSPFYAANFFPRTIGKHEVFQDISDKK